MYFPLHHFYLQDKFISNGGIWGGLIAMSTLAAVIVALFGERFWEWWKRPIIKIEFNGQSERCHRWAIAPQDDRQDQGTFNKVLMWYFRLRVSNNGLSTVRGLRAKVELYDVEKGELADRFEPTALNWITGSGSIDLAPKEDDYLNFISQALEPSDIKYKLRIEVADHSPRGIAWDRYVKPWKLRVAFHADNLPKPVIKFFKFTPPEEGEAIGKLEETSDWN